MICPNCGCNVNTGAIQVSEVDLPMAVDPRYGGHGEIRFDPDHPDNVAYDEATKPGRFDELAELRRMAAL